MESNANSFHVNFPDFSCSLLSKLNDQRKRGQLCDLTVSISGHQFRAHRAVLAASSPYFCDQVLLKNSAVVVLPDVMPPCVFEQLLLSCYTGALSVPSGEVVSFLTAASFLQMWHVVDKCTELLEAASRRHGSARHVEHGSHASSLDDDDDVRIEGVKGHPDHGIPLSAFDSEVLGSSPEDASSECDSDPDSKASHVPPSIMGHQRKVHIKSECVVSEANRPDPNMVKDDLEGKLLESSNGDFSYDEPLDFYGSSAEGFSPAADVAPHPSSEDLQMDGGADAAPVTGGLEEQPCGFNSVGSRFYPCQCGKSFLHKSQRDRHMSMHLGLRPFGCAVCGKSFKMKHHLMGHMKIHTGIKPYECGLCSKRFMWRDSFNRHSSTCARAHLGRRPTRAMESPSQKLSRKRIV